MSRYSSGRPGLDASLVLNVSPHLLLLNEVHTLFYSATWQYASKSLNMVTLHPEALFPGMYFEEMRRLTATVS